MKEIFTKFEEMEIEEIAISQTEEIILKMADIVLENRQLRAEVEELRKVKEEYYQYVNERARASDQASRNMLKAALIGIATGKDDMELAKELAEFM